MKTSSKFNIPDYQGLPQAIRDWVQKLAESMRKNHDDIYYDLKAKTITLPNQDTTPSVKNGHLKTFLCNNSGATTLTDLDDAEEGQQLTLICVQNVAITDGGNFALSANWAPNANDTLTLVHVDGVWIELARSTN